MAAASGRTGRVSPETSRFHRGRSAHGTRSAGFPPADLCLESERKGTRTLLLPSDRRPTQKEAHPAAS